MMKPSQGAEKAGGGGGWEMPDVRIRGGWKSQSGASDGKPTFGGEFRLIENQRFQLWLMMVLLLFTFILIQ